MLTDEVSDWLEGLLLSHDESDFLGLLVSHEFGVASTSLLPLFVSDSVQLGSHLEDALFALLASDLLNLGKLNLLKNKVKGETKFLLEPCSLRDQRSQRRAW